MAHDFQDDIDAVQRIGAVPTILDVVCRATGMGYAAVVRVTEDRWVACQVLDNIHFGLPAGGELPVETTLCHEVRQSRDVIVIDNVAEDPVYFQHQTPKLYGLKSYISMPIILPDGRYFGTLCAIDPKPAALNNPLVIGTFKLFAELIAYHLEADEKLDRANASLLDAEATARLREQFIAVLGHDLRNPLASLDGGINILQREAQSERSTRVLNMMRGSILRMSGLIDNVMDFARGRLGGGLGLRREADRPLGPTLMQVVSEICSAHPERQIDVEIELPGLFDVDHDRLAQMFSNLLGNAITHGSTEHPIRILGTVEGDELKLEIANAGTAITGKAIEKLFQPFSRSDAGTHDQGLGLGLYIASQIAKAHGGHIDVTSDDTQTVFTFRMPAIVPES
ncbi:MULTISPECIES: GAF domain-containing sensor histidine kinase [Rhizobium/Agrobacterium group]|jgi:signal transduction histidine kinase|uniref:GAF domain-containing sensor histidine kinase n=1 Tax=Rhizobium/Agrobacterium group TaxID=227290 RepID=UPI001572FAA9|nr:MULTISPECIES: GAF domain-containing sensor histidine kinase [Rhizobium/Agrobacterium group]MBD8662912.1 GAF domain-containing sensor histidine kinase [Rhizobium sp. CFBP 8752]NSY17934.1 GAF domain-containing sensor histidine kinase [Neorhizobium sp. AL 9.2.2]